MKPGVQGGTGDVCVGIIRRHDGDALHALFVGQRRFSGKYRGEGIVGSIIVQSNLRGKRARCPAVAAERTGDQFIITVHRRGGAVDGTGQRAATAADVGNIRVMQLDRDECRPES